jgi:hypothetical protein
MKHFYSLVLTFISSTTFAQTKFEKGYFIDNQDVRTECLIKNTEWNDTPTEFEYRLNESDKSQIKKDYEVKEFEFGTSKYISANVAIDITSDRIDQISYNKEPKFETRRIFMKVLTEGTSKLYYFGKNEFQRFFFSTKDGIVQQLVHKRYYINSNQQDIAYNNYFRQQLWVNVKCENTTEKDVEKLSYTKSDLIRYFESIDTCKGEKKEESKREESKGSFNLKASVFFGQHGLNIDSGFQYSHDFGSKSYVTFGAEGEYILPIRNNKWSLILEPTYNSYEKKETDGEELSVESKYIMLALGGRHYLFLNDNAKIFFNVVVNYQQISKSSHISSTETGNSESLEFRSTNIHMAFGAGFNYQRFYMEFRYHITTNQSPYNQVFYKYSNFALIGRYRIL